MLDRFRSPILLILACALSVAGAFAQTATGTVSGVVTDPSGAVIGGARIVLLNLGTSAQRSVKSNRLGSFVIAAVPEGEYQVTVSAKGFMTDTTNFKFDIAGQQKLNFKLRVGSQSVTVKVSDAVQRVDTQDATLSSVVDQRQVVDLPLNGRDVFGLIDMQPGVTQSATANQANFISYSKTVQGILPAGGSISFAFNTAGHPVQSNDYTLDGVANNSPIYGGQPGVTPSVDGVQEFRILVSNYTAQYGRNSGGVINVATKAGTDTFHGDAYLFLRNSAFDARTYFDPLTGIAPLRQTQAGGTLGGPILRHHTFFFFSFEALHSFKGSSAIGTFETPEFRALVHQLHPGSGPDQLLQKYPGPAILPGTAVDLGSPSTAYATPGAPDGIPDVGLADYVTNTLNTAHQYSIRIDQNLAANNQLFGRYTWGPSVISPNDPRSPDLGLTETGFQGQGVLYDTHEFNARMVNEFRFGYTRDRVDDTQTAFNVPGVTVTANLGGDNIAGFSGGVQDHTVGAEYTLSDTFSYNRGRHQFKFGYDHHWDQDNGNRFTQTYGALSYRGIFDFASNYADSFAARVNPGQVGGTPTPVGTPDDYRQQDNGIFAQDTWRLTSRFVLDYGFRWDKYSPATEIHDRIGEPVLGSGSTLSEQVMNAVNKRVPYVYDPANQWAPRLGFAWDVFGNGKTSLRGGFAVAYDRLQFLAFRGGIRFNPPDSAGLDLSTRSLAKTLGLTQTQLAAMLGNTLQIPYAMPPGTTSQGFNPGGGPILALTVNGKTATLDAPIGTSAYQSSFTPPYSENYFLSVQQQLTPDMVLEVAYLGNVGRHEQQSGNFNDFPGDDFGAPNPYTGADAGDTSVNHLNQYFTSVLYNTFNTNSSYNGGYVSITKRMSHGLSFASAYTYGHAIDSKSTGRVDDLINPAPTQPYLMRGTSGFDVTQRWSSNFIYQLPFFTNQNKLRGKLLGGWQVQGIIQMQSGTPYTIVTSNVNYDFNGDGQGDDRVDAPLGGFSKYNGISRQRYISGVFGSTTPIGANTLNLPTNMTAAQAVFFPDGLQPAGSCYAAGAKPGKIRQLAGLPCFSEGNVGRNTFRGPGMQTVDASLFKNFGVPWLRSEHAVFQLRAEAFNVLNRTNLQQVSNVLDSRTFGTSTSAFDAREFQFAGKLTF